MNKTLLIGTNQGLISYNTQNGESFDVYSVDGKKIRHHVTNLKGLRSGMYINVCPDISYRCNNAVFLGSQFSYTFNRGRSSVGVAPYARLHIVPLGKFITLYVTAYAPCSLSQDRLQLGFSAKPGIGIRVFPGIYFMGSFGTLGYSYIRTGDSIASGWGSNFSTDTIDLGFFFNL